jgi:hypothetical protein
VRSAGAKTFDVGLQLFDLGSQALAVGTVLCRIDRLAFERRMFGAQGVDLATKPIVLSLDIFVSVFGFVHVQIVARCDPGGRQLAEPKRTL